MLSPGTMQESSDSNRYVEMRSSMWRIQEPACRELRRNGGHRNLEVVAVDAHFKALGFRRVDLPTLSGFPLRFDLSRPLRLREPVHTDSPLRRANGCEACHALREAMTD
jgi:hypothetical protein